MAGSAPPISLVQDVRASPPSPTGIDQRTLARPQAPRGVNPRPPRRVTKNTYPRAPLAATLRGLGAAQMDTSVSAKSRAARQLMADGVPVTGDYVDAIRQSAGFSFGPKHMPKQGFAASSYGYPSQKMVIGATLSGTPIVADMPQGRPPQVTKRPGFPMQISTSPSDDRRKMLSTLQGLGAAATRAPESSPQAAYCNKTYPGGVSAEQSRLADLCKIEMWPINVDPWTQVGKVARGLPLNWTTLAKDVGQVATDVQKIIPPGGSGGTGGAGGAQILGPGELRFNTGLVRGGGNNQLIDEAVRRNLQPSTAGIGSVGIGLAVAGVAAAIYAFTR